MIWIVAQAYEGGAGPFGSVKTECFDCLSSCVCVVRPHFVELVCWVVTRRDRKNVWHIVIKNSLDLWRQDHIQMHNLIFLQVITACPCTSAKWILENTVCPLCLECQLYFASEISAWLCNCEIIYSIHIVTLWTFFTLSLLSFIIMCITWHCGTHLRHSAIVIELAKKLPTFYVTCWKIYFSIIILLLYKTEVSQVVSSLWVFDITLCVHFYSLPYVL
jgi:hypothetical protein